MDQLVKGIAECTEEDGYCMGYPKSHMMILERVNYTRTYPNGGLVAALAAGNQEAGRVLRAQQDWFYRYPYKYKIMELPLPSACGMCVPLVRTICLDLLLKNKKRYILILQRR